MLKKVLLLLMAVFLFGANSMVYAMMCHADSGHNEHAQTVKNTANIGNKICPVTGEKIVEKMKATYEYQGKVYNFCCPVCIDEFKKNPEKYINKLE